MQVWNVLHAARWKYRTQKWCKKSPSAYHRTTLSGYIFATKARIDNRKKNLLSSNISPTRAYNMMNFGLLAAEIVSLVWGTQLISTGFASWQRYCTAKLRRWTDGATCIRQGSHHVGHWPTFLIHLYLSRNKNIHRAHNLYENIYENSPDTIHTYYRSCYEGRCFSISNQRLCFQISIWRINLDSFQFISLTVLYGPYTTEQTWLETEKTCIYRLLSTCEQLNTSLDREERTATAACESNSAIKNYD